MNCRSGIISLLFNGNNTILLTESLFDMFTKDKMQTFNFCDEISLLD